MEGVAFLARASNERWQDIVNITAESEGWFLSYDDYRTWKKGYGRENFNLLVAIDSKTKQTLGCITTLLVSSVQGSEALVFIGTFFVIKERRGSKLGSMLFDKALEDPRFAGLNVGLNGLNEMAEKYSVRRGFDKFCDFKICGLEIPLHEDMELPQPPAACCTLLDEEDVGMRVVFEYDRKIQQAVNRETYLDALIIASNTYSSFALNAFGAVVGFINVREGVNDGLAVGPFYADSEDIALALFVHVFQNNPILFSFKSLNVFPSSTNREFVVKLLNQLSGNRLVDHGYLSPQFTDHSIKVAHSKIFSTTDDVMSFF